MLSPKRTQQTSTAKSPSLFQKFENTRKYSKLSIVNLSIVSLSIVNFLKIIHSLKCTVLFSFVVPLLSLALTHCHLLSLFVSLALTHCHLSLIVSLAATLCYSLYHSLSFVVPRVVTRCTTHCHSMYHLSVFLKTIVFLYILNWIYVVWSGNIIINHVLFTFLLILFKWSVKI